eukprot:Clim_evm67s157 gene=Clim_evmTU67s157
MGFFSKLLGIFKAPAGESGEGSAPEAQTGRSSGGINYVLFFPDKGMPCRYGKSCRRNNCKYEHGETSLTKLLNLLKKAKRSMDICVFNITCNEIADEIEAAHKRGVAVRIVTDDDQMDSQGSDVQALKRKGIPTVHDNSPAHMHNKFVIIDNTIVATGSFNWTRSAVLNNRENILVTSNPQLVKPYIHEFNKLFNEFRNNR